MPFFSVIIPTYNRAALLRQALNSVFAQEFRDFEVVVVDDGSTDGTRDCLASLGERVRCFTQPNRGPGAARNLGAQHATGEYLAFLDSDDLWFPWALEVLAAEVVGSPRPSFIAGLAFEFSDSCSVNKVARVPVESRVFSDYFASSKSCFLIQIGSVAIQRSAFLRCGGFVDRHINAEDSDLWLRLGDQPGFVQILTPPLVAYRRHPESAVSNLSKTFDGQVAMLTSESTGLYAGGKTRRLDRLRIITRHIRPFSLALLRDGLYSRGWELYRRTFAWNFRLGRWRYLVGFFLRWLSTLSRRKK